MAEERSHLTVTRKDDVHIVEFSDRKILDEVCIDEIREELTRLVEDHERIKLLLSFKSVEHLSSAALGVLIMLNKKVSEKHGTLKLSDITHTIFEVFKITRLNKLFSIYDTSEQALNSF